MIAGCGEILGLGEFVDAAGGAGASETGPGGAQAGGAHAGGAQAGGSGSTVAVGGSGADEPPTVPVLRLPRNDAYLGAQRKAGSKRPRFAWEASTSPSDAPVEYELQYSDDPEMTDATSITTSLTEYQPETDLPIALQPPVGRRYYWRVRACIQDTCSEFSRTWWVNIGRPKCDYNADGNDDVAISDFSVHPSVRNKIHFYYGSSSTHFGMTNNGIIDDPTNTNSGFAASIACAGDIDGDGYADVLASAHFANKAFVFMGSSSDRFTRARNPITVTYTSEEGLLGPYMTSAGDVNGDGFSDVIIGTIDRTMPAAYVYLGSPTGLDTPFALELGGAAIRPEYSSVRVSAAGDVNGDGFSDVMVAFQTGDGETVRVYHGAPGRGFDSTPRAELVTASGNFEFVSSLDAAGDVNGDGFGDVILGVEDDNVAYIYLGGPQGLESTPSVALYGSDSFGATVASIGDINNDGFDDIAVADRSPKVLIYLGDKGPKLDEPDAAIYRDSIEDRTGQRLGSPGDINGDGYADFTIAMTEANLVHFYYGRSTITSPLAEDASISKPPSDSEFGFAVAHR